VDLGFDETSHYTTSEIQMVLYLSLYDVREKFLRIPPRLFQGRFAMKKFLDKNNIIAVVGASPNKEKWGWKIFTKLRESGFKVYPVNPKHEKIDNARCYPDLKSLPKKPDVVITIVPPHITEKVVEQCKKLGIEMVWMQPGSESEEAIKFCRENGIEVVYNACFVVDGLKDIFQ